MKSPRPESRSDVDPAAASEEAQEELEVPEGVCSCAGSGVSPVKESIHKDSEPSNNNR